MGIRDRGIIALGFAGDLVVVDLDELHYERELLVQDTPGGSKRFTRPAGGYRCGRIDHPAGGHVERRPSGPDPRRQAVRPRLT